MVTQVLLAALRSVETVKIAFVNSCVSLVLNILINSTLIYGRFGFPEMGVAGASLATVLGQFVAFVIAISVILRGNGFLKLELKRGFKPDKPVLTDMLGIGLPAMGEQLVMRAGMILYAKTVASLGTIAFATHQVCMNIQALSFMSGQAFAVSATSLMGQSLGKRRTDMAQAYTSRTRTVGFCVSMCLAVIFALFGKQIVGLYNSDPEIIRIGGRIMLFVALLQPFQGSQFIIAGGLRGAGDTKTTARITFITVLLVRPFVAMLLVRTRLWLYGAWVALA
jgi:putative MATE family efflux protein